MTRSLTVAALLALAACAPPPTDANKDGIADGVRTPTDVSLVAPSSPVGTVSGQVVNSRFGALDGTNLVLVIGGKTDSSGLSFKATTDADGNFAFKNVPAGASGELTASRAGFGSVRVNLNVPAAAGNFPLNDGNANVGMLMLMELSGAQRFVVMTSSGRPAKGAKALLEVAPVGAQSYTSTGYGQLLGQLSVDTAVDQDGYANFTGIPTPGEMARVNPVGTGYTLIIGDLDEDGDGRVDYNGQVATFTGTSLFTRAPQPIVLSDARSPLPLSIVASNVDTLAGGSGLPLRNFVKPSDPVSVFFNQPVIDRTVVVKVTDESCDGVAGNVAVSVTMRADHWGFTVAAANGSWVGGKKLNIAVRATGLDAANTMSRTGYFFGADPLQATPLSSTARFEFRKGTNNTDLQRLQAGDSLYVVFDEPISQLGGTGGRAFINVDLNANASMNDYGEYNAPFALGLPIYAAEPAQDPDGTFVCRASGYTTRYLITFPPLPPASSTQIGPNSQLKVILPKDTSTTDGYQTIWGQPASTATNDTFSGTLTLGQ